MKQEAIDKETSASSQNYEAQVAKKKQEKLDERMGLLSEHARLR